MKLNEVIELNGKEYTVELNRESILRINQYVNFNAISKKYKNTGVEDKSEMEISENENPFEQTIDEEQLEKDELDNFLLMKKTITRAFWIWLYPVEKLSYTDVEKILKPYFEDATDENANYIVDKYEELTNKSVEIRQNYLEEVKNLKAQVK